MKERVGFVSNSSSSSFIISFTPSLQKTYDVFKKEMNPKGDVSEKYIKRVWNDLHATHIATETDLREEISQLILNLYWREIVVNKSTEHEVIADHYDEVRARVGVDVDLNGEVYILEYDDNPDPVLESGEPMRYLNCVCISKH